MNTVDRKIAGRIALLVTSAMLLSGSALAEVGSPQVPSSVVWTTPPPTQTPVKEGMIDVGGARLWYWDTGGDGEPLILLHPQTGSAASWEYQQPVFAKAGFRVIGYSRRGHFRSERAGAEEVAAADDLLKLSEALGIRRFHLVGSAAGSFVAADFALSHPEKLLTLVLASSTLNAQDPDHQEVLKRLIPKGFYSLPADFRELGPSYRAGNPDGTARWNAIEAQSRERGLPLPPSINRVTLDKLANLPMPLLLISGDADLYLPHAVALQVVRKVRRAELVLVENAAHAVFWERPEEFNKAVLDFIARRGRASASTQHE